jgi:hypothetical protein
MSVSIFKTPSIFMLIEKHLDWRDFIHLLCTCKELYFEWVSKDIERWKKLKIPRYICKHILHIPVSKEPGPVMQMRKRAIDALVVNIKDNCSRLPCMGGCGQYIFAGNIVSKELDYVVCYICGVSRSPGVEIVNKYLKSNGYTIDCTQVAFEHAILKLGQKMFLKKHDVIKQLWFGHYSNQLKAIYGWKFEVFSIKSIQIEMEKQLIKQGFI